jgi:hypothetical protein
MFSLVRVRGLLLGRESIPRIKPVFCGLLGPKAEALGYLEATAKEEADALGDDNQRGNGNNKSKNKQQAIR